ARLPDDGGARGASLRRVLFRAGLLQLRGRYLQGDCAPPSDRGSTTLEVQPGDGCRLENAPQRQIAIETIRGGVRRRKSRATALRLARFQLRLQGRQHLLEVLFHFHPQQLAEQAANQGDVEFKVDRYRRPRGPVLRRERPLSFVSLEVALALPELADV